MFTDYLTTELGLVEISATEQGVSGVYFVDKQRQPVHTYGITDLAKQQLQAYFTGQSKVFDLPLDQSGTPFQQQVWQALMKIPYGQVASYAELAHAINNPKAVRAVGAANGKNPISIIVPCHRVIGADGTLTGYAGGLERKQWLLQHESSDLFKV